MCHTHYTHTHYTYTHTHTQHPLFVSSHALFLPATERERVRPSNPRLLASALLSTLVRSPTLTPTTTTAATTTTTTTATTTATTATDSPYLFCSLAARAEGAGVAAAPFTKCAANLALSYRHIQFSGPNINLLDKIILIYLRKMFPRTCVRFSVTYHSLEANNHLMQFIICFIKS